IYFFVNMNRETVEPEVSFHRLRGPAVLCDPRTGDINAVKTVGAGKGSRLRLTLGGLSAVFVIFG
ncbi:MAG: hypothetical protein M1436_02475, partial [Acidobacteria bacterium]|nr:hypothetical protein [Acidobacteriota bacterium]